MGIRTNPQRYCDWPAAVTCPEKLSVTLIIGGSRPNKGPVPDVALAAVRAFWDLNRQLSGAHGEPDEAWRAAAQRAAQQLRACGSGAVSPGTPRPAPALASFGEVASRSFEESKLIALETIADAARLWIQLNQPDEEEEDGEED
ncbi:predicted protein [Verticillium alfalfae VaMs.102]|uniref:Predicted protein n=1 Tax=Verticillium alfalfae (strain VaMs.102 / ATCC MYA-4576 / FGSC 10136) TaxID=526221 RepID=C9SZ17_VERA1|nr:predicted protein [Verticillium alfalfae VaMs.102]EEY24032.1 predicted protein [Verticillium alfalfae VaMs.102]